MADPAQSDLSDLQSLPVPTLSATLFSMGFGSCFLAGLAPLDAENASFVGPAYTMRALPSRKDVLDRIASGALPNLHRQGLAEARAGDVIVTDCGGDAGISFFGELIATHLKQKGLAAVVTDAGFADVIDVAATGLTVFSQGSAPVPAPVRRVISDLQRPVECMGVTIYPGDILVGDRNGVVAIPKDIVPDVLCKAGEKEDLERFLLTQLQNGASLEGTYPPNQEMLALYEASKSEE